MPRKRNGREHNIFKRTEGAVDEHENFPPNDTEHEPDFGGKIFRGFVKSPVVVLNKIDITPYLNENTRKPIKRKPTNLNTDAKRFKLRQVTVHVVRQDLEELLQALRRNHNKQENYKTPQNPSDSTIISCQVCAKTYDNVKKLQNHISKKHMIVYKNGDDQRKKRVSFSDKVIYIDAIDYHRCRKCNDTFHNYKDLKTHMKLEHKKRKCYVCYYCSKTFVDRIFFKVHIKLHCDTCGVLFLSKSKVAKHKRDSCLRIQPNERITLQTANFAVSTLNIYKCHKCNEKFHSECFLNHHISHWHTKKKPDQLYYRKEILNNNLFVCNYCNMTSVDKEAMIKHIALLPDINNYLINNKACYSCELCTKQFDDETDLLRHDCTNFYSFDKKENSITFANNNKINGTSENLCKSNPILYYILNNPADKGFSVRSPVQIQTSVPIVTNHIANIAIENNVSEVTRVSIGDSVNGHIVSNGTKTIINMSPIVSLTKLEITPEYQRFLEQQKLKNDSEDTSPKEEVVKKKLTKTLFSNHQCSYCQKYYSSNYCLNRHIETMHRDLAELKCKECEEVFVWPSLLLNHVCLRMKRKEPQFDHMRPEVYFNNYDQPSDIFDQRFDDHDCSNDIDFEMPAPIVELTELDSSITFEGNEQGTAVGSAGKCDGSNGNVVKVGNYTLLMQEVPIEF